MAKHAILGASSAARWKACPGSVREIARLPKELREQTSTYALEGNAAHALAEYCLVHEADPTDYIGGSICPDGVLITTRGKCPSGFFEITEEMADAVRVYINAVYGHLERLPGSELLVEQTVKPLAERDDMFGTADAIIVEPYGEVVVLDFKYGKGHVVDVEFNDQALFYALGALERVGDDAEVSAITIVIVQPRAYHEDGVVREWRTTVEQVRAEADQLRSAARATEDPAAPLIPGEAQCRFCPAAARCPALSQLAIRAAVDDFPDDLTDEPVVRLPDPSDPAQIARALKLRDLVETWASEVGKMAYFAAQRGTTIPGYKLVRTSKHRQWIDEDLVAAVVRRDSKIDPERCFTEPRLKSPAQLEKVLGKQWVAERTTRPEGDLALVPDTDKRPAALPAVLADYPEDI